MRRRSLANARCPEWTRDAALVIWQQLDQILEATRLASKSTYSIDPELDAFIDRVSSLITNYIPANQDN